MLRYLRFVHSFKYSNPFERRFPLKSSWKWKFTDKFQAMRIFDLVTFIRLGSFGKVFSDVILALLKSKTSKLVNSSFSPSISPVVLHPDKSNSFSWNGGWNVKTLHLHRSAGSICQVLSDQNTSLNLALRADRHLFARLRRRGNNFLTLRHKINIEIILVQKSEYCKKSMNEINISKLFHTA